MAQTWENVAAAPLGRRQQKALQPTQPPGEGMCRQHLVRARDGANCKAKDHRVPAGTSVLGTGRLNKCDHTGLQVKWKDAKCPRLRAWGGFVPLKSIRLISTSSLISLV